MVNRLWQGHFGRGLVATPSDFGTMGDEPSHPELLDWLATEFVARGWSLKAMHRLIVTSATYRQSSRPRPTAGAADPENTLLSRQNRRRLDGEAIRDALLAVSGQLNPAIGGPVRLPRAARRADEAQRARGRSGRSRPAPRTGTAGASTSSSGATCATPSSRRSTAPTRTRAARAGPSRRSPRRPSACSTASSPRRSAAPRGRASRARPDPSTRAPDRPRLSPRPRPRARRDRARGSPRTSSPAAIRPPSRTSAWPLLNLNEFVYVD